MVWFHSLICATLTNTGLDVFSAAMYHLLPPLSMKARTRQVYIPSSSPLTSLKPSMYSPAAVRSRLGCPHFPWTAPEDVLETTTPLRSIVTTSLWPTSQVTSRARVGRLSAATRQRRLSALPGARTTAVEGGVEVDEAFTLRD